MLVVQCNGQYIELEVLPLRVKVLVGFCRIAQVLHFLFGNAFFGQAIAEVLPGFHFYKMQTATAAGNDVHFPVPVTPVAMENGIPGLLQVVCRELFAHFAGMLVVV